MDRDETLYNYAERCAKKYYELAKDDKVAGLTQHDRKLLEEGKAAFVDWYADAMRNKLASSPDYSEENWDDKKAERLEKTKEYDGINFLLYGGKSPEQSHEEAEFSKFKELVEDGAWYRMTPGAISAWASEKGGYDWGSKADRDRFWNDLSKFDIMYNRGRIAQEFGNSWAGKIAALASPSAYEEGMRQAVTGDYDDSRMNKLAALDLGANILIGATPIKTLSGMTAPIATGAVQGALEAGRQGAKTFIAPDLEPDWNAPLFSAGAGAGVPAGAMYLQGLLQKGGQGAFRSFGRGFARGARGVDPVAEERANIVSNVLQARKTLDKSLNSAVDAAEKGKEVYARVLKEEIESGSDMPTAIKVATQAQKEVYKDWEKGSVLGGAGTTPAEFEQTRAARGITEKLGLLDPSRENPVMEHLLEGKKRLRVKSDVANAFDNYAEDMTWDILPPDIDFPARDAVTGNYSMAMGETNTPYSTILYDLAEEGPVARFGTHQKQWNLANPEKKIDGLATGITKEERRAMTDYQNSVKAEFQKALDNYNDDQIGLPSEDNIYDFPPVADIQVADEVFYGLPEAQQELIRSGSNKLNRTYSLAKVMRWYDRGTPKITDEKAWDAFAEAFPAKAQEYLVKFNGGNVSDKNAYLLGQGLGNVAGKVGTSFEPALGISSITAPFADKVEAFKQSEWYNNLPEQRKNALEAAFKKMQEEEKAKKASRKTR